MTDSEKQQLLALFRSDWNVYCKHVLRVNLDPQQQEIITAIQNNRKVAVASGTARGKDFVSACAALCFLYLTPEFENGNLVGNTKVAMTAPSARQVGNIMTPEVRRLMRNMLPEFRYGRQVANDIRTDYEEWFLTGFKADDNNHEAWSGFHATNVMFIVTEASGIPETVFDAIEGNLQGNSRLLIVFNPNKTTGYAAKAMRGGSGFTPFRLSSLDAPNVVQRKQVISGQVDYEWVKDRVELWCERIDESQANATNGDFEFNGQWHKPNDLFRVKVLGMFPIVDEDVLVPFEWVEAANERWKLAKADTTKLKLLGVDVAGMGRDESIICKRYGNYVCKFTAIQSKGTANQTEVAGIVSQELKGNALAMIDTIGEGAGVHSILVELFNNGDIWFTKNINEKNREVSISCKFSEGGTDLTDATGEYQFMNMKAYLYWAIRDALNPALGGELCIPPDPKLMEELTAIKWKVQSNGKIAIEKKEETQKRIKRSPDRTDALANSFYPIHIEKKVDWSVFYR